MEKSNFALGKLNFAVCGVAVLLVLLGFILMGGESSSIEGGFNPDIFSTRRIVVAPMLCLVGFLMMIVGILLPHNKTDE